VDRHQWDERYGGDELLWTSAPNQFLVSEVAGLPAGSAVDLACGEGRNAVWLAEQGWVVTGVDFSSVGLAKAQRLAQSRQVDVRWVESAVQEWTAPADGFDLVAVFYLQLPQPERSVALTVAAASVAPGGTLLVVAHDRDNLTRGFGGPPDDAVLYSVGDVTDVAEANGLIVQRAEQAVRFVETESGVREAIDTLVRAVRPV
jgi:2-polyprenyl-3-methyl-5-hydroxy-6-metoxy-1,4-benzoquinol methylase